MAAPSSDASPPMSTILHLIMIRLSSTNYLLWVNQMVPLLKYQQLLSHVDGSAAAPESIVLVDNKPTPNPVVTEWAAADQRPVILLQASLSEEAFSEVVGISTSRDMWVALEAAYGNSSMERVQNLRDQLCLLTKGTSSVSEYGRKFKTLCDQLSAIGHAVAESDKQHWFLCGLGSSFEVFSTSVHTTGTVTGFRDLLAKAEGHEIFMKSIHPADPPHVAFSAAAHGSAPAAGSASGRGQGFAHQGGGRGGRGHGRRSPHCQLCRQNGHYANQCPKLAYFASPSPVNDSDLVKAFLAKCNLNATGPDWYVDSGASDHMVSSSGSVNQPEPFGGDGSVQFGNGSGNEASSSTLHTNDDICGCQLGICEDNQYAEQLSLPYGLINENLTVLTPSTCQGPTDSFNNNYFNDLIVDHCISLSKMKTLLMVSTIFFLAGFYFSKPLMLTLIGFISLLLVAPVAVVLVTFSKELLSNDHPPPVVGSIFNMLIHFHHFFDYLTSIARNHHTFRFVTPTHSEVYITDPINVEHILKTNFPNYTKGDNHKGIMGDLFGNGIFAVDGDIWRHQRKLASHEFSTKVLRDFSTAVGWPKLVKKVSEAAVDNQIIALQDLLMKSTLDSIFKVGFGFDLETLSGLDETSNQFMTAFDDSNCIIFRRHVDVLWRIKRYFNIGSEAVLKKHIRVIDNFVYELIEHKRAQMKNGKLNGDKDDILSRFLIESEKNNNLSDEYLRDISLSFIIAGKDTSASTLTWFFYMLCKHPEIQEKLALEVKQATGSNYSNSIDEFSLQLTESALEKMHYLHSALTETLRLYPAVAIDGKCSENDDVLPDGFKIKKGDGITYMPYPMGRMTYIWGEDAEEFRPERWLHDGVFQSESPFKFTAFQGGPRICLGKEFAYRQMKIMASFLVFFFKFQLVDKNKEAKYRTMLTLHMDKGLDLYALPRTKY